MQLIHQRRMKGAEMLYIMMEHKPNNSIKHASFHLCHLTRQSKNKTIQNRSALTKTFSGVGTSCVVHGVQEKPTETGVTTIFSRPHP